MFAVLRFVRLLIFIACSEACCYLQPVDTCVRTKLVLLRETFVNYRRQMISAFNGFVDGFARIAEVAAHSKGIELTQVCTATQFCCKINV